MRLDAFYANIRTPLLAPSPSLSLLTPLLPLIPSYHEYLTNLGTQQRQHSRHRRLMTLADSAADSTKWDSNPGREGQVGRQRGGVCATSKLFAAMRY